MTILLSIIAAEVVIFAGAAIYTLFINPPPKEDAADVARVLDYLE